MNWGIALACGLAVWPGFRGPNGAGISTDSKALPGEIAPDRNVLWKIPLAPGSSSPVLTRDRLYITAFEQGKLQTIAMDRATGRALWRRELDPVRTEKRHQLNNAASATPITDGVNIYSFFSDFGLVAYGPDGNELWRLPLGPFTNLHGMGASPILAGNRLVLVCDQDVDSFMIAVDKRNGKQLWRVERPAVVHGFATPTLLGEHQLIVPGSYLLTSYSLASGEELWSVRGLTWQIKNTAVVDQDGTVYVTGWAPGADPGESKPLPPFETAAAEIDANRNGVLEASELNPSQYKHGGSWRAIDLDDNGAIDKREWGFYRGRRAARNVTLAIRPGNARGDLTDTHVLWRNEKFVPQVSSPLLYQGVLYTIKDGGILASIDPKNGAVLKSARIPGAIDAYYSSPVAGDGKLYIASEKGKLSVVKAGGAWEPLHVADFDEGIYATPAIDSGRIYLRTASSLYCFGAK